MCVHLVYLMMFNGRCSALAKFCEITRVVGVGVQEVTGQVQDRATEVSAKVEDTLSDAATNVQSAADNAVGGKKASRHSPSLAAETGAAPSAHLVPTIAAVDVCNCRHDVEHES